MAASSSLFSNELQSTLNKQLLESLDLNADVEHCILAGIKADSEGNFDLALLYYSAIIQRAKIEMTPWVSSKNKIDAYIHRGKTYLKQCRNGSVDCTELLNKTLSDCRNIIILFEITSFKHRPTALALARIHDHMTYVLRCIETFGFDLPTQAKALEQLCTALTDIKPFSDPKKNTVVTQLKEKITTQINQVNQKLLTNRQTNESPSRVFDPKTYLNRAEIYYTTKQWDSAFENCIQSIEVDPTLALAYYLLGKLYSDVPSSHQIKPAIKDKTKIQEHDFPFDSRYSYAIAAYSKAIELGLSDSLREKAYLSRGNAYDRIRETRLPVADSRGYTLMTLTIADYQQALALHQAACADYRARKNTEQALNIKAAFDISWQIMLPSFNRIIQQIEQRLLPLNKATLVLAQLRDALVPIEWLEAKTFLTQEVAQCQRRINEAIIKMAERHFNQGKHHCAQQDRDKAISEYTQTLELNPNHVEAYVRRGGIYLAQCDNKQHRSKFLTLAIEDYCSALKLNPTHDHAYADLRNALTFIDIDLETSKTLRKTCHDTLVYVGEKNSRNSFQSLFDGVKKTKRLLNAVCKALEEIDQRIAAGNATVVDSSATLSSTASSSMASSSSTSSVSDTETPPINVEEYCHNGKASVACGDYQGAIQWYMVAIAQNAANVPVSDLEGLLTCIAALPKVSQATLLHDLEVAVTYIESGAENLLANIKKQRVRITLPEPRKTYYSSWHNINESDPLCATSKRDFLDDSDIFPLEFKNTSNFEIDAQYAHYISQGNTHLTEGKLPEAATHYHNAIDLDATKSSAYYGCGKIHVRQRQYQEAIQWYRAGISKNPTCAPTAEIKRLLEDIATLPRASQTPLLKDLENAVNCIQLGAESLLESIKAQQKRIQYRLGMYHQTNANPSNTASSSQSTPMCFDPTGFYQTPFGF